MSWLFASGHKVLESLSHDIMYVELFLTFVSPDSSRRSLYACLATEGGLRLNTTPLSGSTLNLWLSPWIQGCLFY